MRSLHTEHVALNRTACEACGRCVEACSRGVLKVISMLGLHKHALVKSAELCTGCLKCVRACPQGALYSIQGSGK
ncbi:4Fe-4S binding protein [bacterium]|nr:4Fe-4S binding protein [bacterium]